MRHAIHHRAWLPSLSLRATRRPCLFLCTTRRPMQCRDSLAPRAPLSRSLRVGQQSTPHALARCQVGQPVAMIPHVSHVAPCACVVVVVVALAVLAGWAVSSVAGTGSGSSFERGRRSFKLAMTPSIIPIKSTQYRNQLDTGSDRAGVPVERARMAVGAPTGPTSFVRETNSLVPQVELNRRRGCSPSLLPVISARAHDAQQA